jgi:hypothetical protein
MLDDLPKAQDQGETLIRKRFPRFNLSANSLSKWWSLELANLATKSDSFAVMSAAETENKLKKALVLRMVIGVDGKAPAVVKDKFLTKLLDRFKKPETKEKQASPEVDAHLVSFPLSDFARLKNRIDAKSILGQAYEQLNEIMLRGFPLYRPIAMEYRAIIGELMDGKEKNLKERFDRLEAIRTEVLQQSRGVESYLDWMEANSSQKKSGAFDDYWKAVKNLDTGPTKRDDPVAKYLDALEGEWNLSDF